MAVVFKYKSPISQTYAPGMSKPGAAGPIGIKGNSGNAVYFIDFDLDNSYNIEQALQKIENNKIISINDDKDLLYHAYQVNDILLSNTGKCYRISEKKDTTFSNYEFDIEYLGEISKTNISPVKIVMIFDLTNAVFYKEGTTNGSYAGDIIKEYKSEELSCYLTNRTEKPYVSKFSVNNKDYSLIGSWIKIAGYSLEDTTPKYDATDGGIYGSKHSFVIQLDNNKNMSCDSIPVEYNSEVIQTDETGGYSINFKKKLEYPNIKTFENLSLGNSKFINSLFHELLPDNKIRLKDYEYSTYSLEEMRKTPRGLYAKDIRRFQSFVPECTTAYLSDYSLDDLHPSGNNIRCTINNDRTMWYKSGVKAGENSENLPNNITTSGDFYKELYVDKQISDNDEDVETSFKIKKDILDSLQTFGAGFTYTPTNFSLKEKVIKNGVISYKQYEGSDSSTSTFINPNIFPKFAIGLSLSEANEEDIQKELNSLYRFGFHYDGENIDNDYYYRGYSQFYMSRNSDRLDIVSYLRDYVYPGTILLNGVYDRDSYLINPFKTVEDNSNKSSSPHVTYTYSDDSEEKIYLKDVNGKNVLNMYLSELNTYDTMYKGNTTSIEVAYTNVNNGDDIQYSNILQYPKYPSYVKNGEYVTNYKGGNSLYFSGMDNPEDTYQNIFNYIVNQDNTFSIITSFEKTKEMITTNVPVVINTTFKDSSVYIRFGQGVDKKSTITGIRVYKNKKNIANYTYK